MYCRRDIFCCCCLVSFALLPIPIAFGHWNSINEDVTIHQSLSAHTKTAPALKRHIYLWLQRMISSNHFGIYFFSKKKRTKSPPTNQWLSMSKFNRFDVTDTTVNIKTLLCTGWIVCSSIHDETKVYNIFSSSTGGPTLSQQPIQTHSSTLFTDSVLHFEALFSLFDAFFCSFTVGFFFFRFSSAVPFLNVWNFDLFQRILVAGALLSRNFLSTKPLKWFFFGRSKSNVDTNKMVCMRMCVFVLWPWDFLFAIA